jgi:ribonucleoside-diphosphate reductase beta chain
MIVEAINWNSVVDPIDSEVWTKLVQNFWVDTRIAFSNDIKTWASLTDAERETTTKVFAGLTLLDTIQSQVGAVTLLKDARTAHEAAVLTNIAFMESIHAKTYSSIFSTLLSSDEIEEAFRWAADNEFLQKKAKIVLEAYNGDDPEKRKILSVLLESFLFYSGFFMPFWWSSKAKLTNTADAVRLILRDEAIHGYYIGQKFQQSMKEHDLFSASNQKELEDFTYAILDDLYANEIKYAAELYDPIGLTEYVKPFVRYQGNKALQNLGMNPRWSAAETEVHPAILASLSSSGGENHDFFSGAGSTYQLAKEEETVDDDWDF